MGEFDSLFETKIPTAVDTDSVELPKRAGSESSFESFFEVSSKREIPGEEEPLAGGLTASFGRVLGAGVSGAVEGAKLDDPLGFDPETVQNLRDSGFFHSDPHDPLGVFKTASEMLIRTTVGALDLVTRGFTTTIEAGVQAVQQIGAEFGMTKHERKRLGKDLHMMIESAFIVAGSSAFIKPPGAPGVSRVLAARRLSNRVEKSLLKTLKGQPQSVKDEAVRLSRTSLNQTLEELTLAQAKSKIGGPTLGKNARAAEFTLYDETVTKYIDGLHPIKLLGQRAARATGEAIEAEVPAAYMNMRLHAGAKGVTETVFKKSGVKWAENGDLVANGPGLHQVLRPVSDDLENFAAYMAGKRGQVLSRRGLEVPFTNPELKVMAALEQRFPHFKQVHDEWIEFNKGILDFAEQSGLLNAASKKAYLDAGESYVPFYRLVTDPTGKAAQVGGSVFARARGSAKPLNEIIENMYKNTGMWIDLSLQNAAKLRVFDDIETLGLKHVASRVKTVPVQAIITDRKIAQGLKDLGVKPTKDGHVMSKVITVGQRGGKNSNVEMVFRNGKREYWEIHDPVFRMAMDSIHPEAHGMVMRIASGFSRTLRAGVTLSPEFQFRNIIRDTQVATVQADKGLFIPAITSLRGMMSRIRKDDNYWEALRNGAGFSSIIKGERQAARDLARFHKSMALKGLNPAHILDTPLKVKQGFELVAEAFEMSSRLGAHRLARKRGATARRAAFEARDITTDFAVRGSEPMLRNIMSMIPFLNPRVQGLRKMVLSAKENPARFATKALLMTTIPELALYAINKNNPDWVGLADWDKDLFWHIPLPESTGVKFLRIPKGFEIGQLFGTVPRRILEAIEQRHGKKFATSMLRMITETFSVGPPQFAAPITTVISNSKFTGAPVEPVDLKKRKASLRYRPWTSSTLVLISKAMSEELGVEFSPLKIQELLRGYFGTLGMYALSASDALVDRVLGKNRRSKRLDEMPFARSFFSVGPTINTQFSTDFFDLHGAAKEAAMTVEALKELDITPTLKNFTQRERDLAALRPKLQETADQLSEIMKNIRRAEFRTDIGPDEKLKIFNNLLASRNKILESTMRAVPEKILKRRGLTIPVKRGLLAP